MASLVSAVFVDGGRRVGGKSPFKKGSGQSVEVQESLMLGEEMSEQLNKARVQARKTVTAANAATSREVLLVALEEDLFVEDLRLTNTGAAALSNAATDIRIMEASNGDLLLGGAGPAAPINRFFAEGFAGLGNNFPASTEEDVVETTADALTQPFKGPFILRKGQGLIVELINNEGGSRSLDVSVTYAITDRLVVQPRDFARQVTNPNRRIHRTSRGVI